MFKGILLSVAIFIFSLSALADCPLGEKEDHLTIQRVMRNFGRFIMPAENIAYRGQNKYDQVSDADLQEAIEKLSYVISCADAVIANPTGDLLPTVARSMTGDELKNYVDSLTFMMDEFKLSVTDYQSAFIKILAQPKEQRDLTGLLKMTQDQDALVEKAHKKL
jgi:hypothetical protein